VAGFPFLFLCVPLGSSHLGPFTRVTRDRAAGTIVSVRGSNRVPGSPAGNRTRISPPVATCQRLSEALNQS
jgi:hypothetical protein